MSCRHANPIGACALCEEVTNAWDRGFATGEEKAKARIAELTDKVASLREALNAIDVIACVDRSHPVISTLARNVLKE